MPTQQITFLKGDSISSETDYRDALPVNMYAVNRPMFGAQGYMKQDSGLTQFATTGGATRGALWNERFKDHYRVEGGSFVSVDQFGGVRNLGSIGGGSTASMPYSFLTQAIISNGQFYLYDSTSGLREVTDPIASGTIDGVWVDGVYFCTNGQDLYHSTASDESQFEPGTRVAEFMPDDSLGIGKTQDNKAIVFGRYTTEYFVNTGAPQGFLFQRLESRAVKAGIVGTHCKCELDGKWYILGGRKEESPTVRIISVGQTQKVASKEVDQIIGQYSETELQSVVMESYAEDGYSFVIIHLPNETLKFNETIAPTVGVDAAWSIMKSGVNNDQWQGKHGVNDIRLNKWIYGDKRLGRLGILDETASTQYGEIAEWLLYTPFIMMDRKAVRHFEVEVLPGHTDIQDATVFMSLSYDGVSFGNEWLEMYGDPNDYTKRFIIRRLGYVSDWFGVKIRGTSRSRMAFGRGFINYG